MKEKLKTFFTNPVGMAVAGLVIGLTVGYFLKKGTWGYVIASAVGVAAGFAIGIILKKKGENK